MIFDSFDSPVSSSNPSFDDEKERLASVAGKSPPGNFARKSTQLIEIYLSVFSSLSRLSVSSMVEIPRVFREVVTPLFSPDGVNREES